MMMPRERRLRAAAPAISGFSLLELIVAMAVFLIVSSVSFTLFGRHQALLTEEQVTVGLNIGLRNALSQVQLDIVNAGNGLNLGSANVTAFPVGVVIQNSDPTAATCNPTTPVAGFSFPVYPQACFDQFSIVVVDPATPPLHPCVGSSCTLVTSTASSLTGQFAPAYVASTSTYAPDYKTGDQVLFVQACSAGSGQSAKTVSGSTNTHATNSNGCMFTTAILTSAGAATTSGTGCAAGCVTLNYDLTGAGGTNASSNDPLGMTTAASPPAGTLTDTFDQNSWVVRLLPITYYMDASNQNDPQLIRKQAGISNVLMDQVIGFKVGATIWNSVTSTSSFEYNYDNTSYGSAYNLIRSVRVSIIGRTPPNPTLSFHNQFDGGPYQVRGNSIIVNPRNLTMNGD